jgi:hypothetical protein
VFAKCIIAKYKAALKRTFVSQDIKDFASAFPVLQEARNLADYDPTIYERTDVLALMMIRVRG